MDPIEKMRAEWDERARSDPYFYAAFARRGQTTADFFASAADTLPTLEAEFQRLPPAPPEGWRALEIGCGPGRLMRPMSAHFGEIHGVDISPEMLELARRELAGVPHAQVHLTPQSDLSMFGTGSFDFVYSYTVFQHIPEREIVLGYLRESLRVLKPGGILCCQLRGASPLETEMQRESDTWTGCSFGRSELIAFSRETQFQIVALSGLETQYLWTTWRRPVSDPLPDSPAPLNRKAELKAVTASGGGGMQIPQRGRDACVSLWIDGLSQGFHLGSLEVSFGQRRQRGCYLSPVGETGACQLNAMVPDGVPAGETAVGVLADGATIPSPCMVTIVPVQFDPTVVSVTDAINLESRYRIETRGVKVTLEGIEQPNEVSFRVGRKRAAIVQVESKDPVSLKYEYSFYLPPGVVQGVVTLGIRAGGRDLDPIAVDVI